MTDVEDKVAIAVLREKVKNLEKRANDAKEREHFIVNSILTLAGIAIATGVALLIAYVKPGLP